MPKIPYDSSEDDLDTLDASELRHKDAEMALDDESSKTMQEIKQEREAYEQSVKDAEEEVWNSMMEETEGVLHGIYDDDPYPDPYYGDDDWLFTQDDTSFDLHAVSPHDPDEHKYSTEKPPTLGELLQEHLDHHIIGPEEGHDLEWSPPAP